MKYMTLRKVNLNHLYNMLRKVGFVVLRLSWLMESLVMEDMVFFVTLMTETLKLSKCGSMSRFTACFVVVHYACMEVGY